MFPTPVPNPDPVKKVLTASDSYIHVVSKYMWFTDPDRYGIGATITVTYHKNTCFPTPPQTLTLVGNLKLQNQAYIHLVSRYM